MTRIADSVISRLKAEVSLVRLAESQGYQLTRQGKDFALCCPFHADKTPSCVITPSSNLFHCFGCNAGGSVIDWVMKTQGLSFRQAVLVLQEDQGCVAVGVAVGVEAIEAPRTESPVAESAPLSAPPRLRLDAEPTELLQDLVDFYHRHLWESPEALAYWDKRGLQDEALIQEFELGFCNRRLGFHIPRRDSIAGAQARQVLQALGVWRANGQEHLAGCVVVPLYSLQGSRRVVAQLYGRKIANRLRGEVLPHWYLPGEQAGVFNLRYLRAEQPEEIILCEALIDALTFCRWGFRNVTSSFGVNGFTAELLETLVLLKVKRVLIAYDRDEAGDRGAESVAKQLNEKGIEAFRILFPHKMDVNEYANHMVPPQKALALVIRQAQWLSRGVGGGAVPQVSTAAVSEEKSFSLAAHAAHDVAEENTAKMNSVHESAKNHELNSYNPVQTIDVTASPIPPQPLPAVALETRGDALFLVLGDEAQPHHKRTYRVRGLDNNPSPEQLKIQLYAQRGEGFFIDKLDLYSSKQRQVFINQACVELGLSDEVLKKDLGKLLLALEQAQLKKNAAQGSANVAGAGSAGATLSHTDREAALDLLRDKHLPERILSDFALAGVVGEETNKLVGYLASVSRKCERPLAVVIQSSSAAGKSSLMDAVLAFMPEEERVQYSAMTGQSLFYMGETRLKNKILAISEEEGAHTASYALKLLQSEGEVNIASTGKDDASGQLVTREYKVEGPVMLFMTTTAIDVDEELLNRCLVLTVNETREQTEAIHKAQRLRRTLQGLAAKLHKEQVLQVHRNAQRLLKPLAVINPYADQLTFLSDKTRTRRDHEKYLTLIDSIALLHQYQRATKTLPAGAGSDQTPLEYLEVIPSDIELANRLAHEVLGKTLDELPPQTRKLLKAIQHWVQESCRVDAIEQKDFRFSRKQLREVTGWGNTQLKIHVARLEDMELLIAHSVPRSKALSYELLFDGSIENPEPHCMGLLDVSRLSGWQLLPAKSGVATAKSGFNEIKSGSGRPLVGGGSDVDDASEPSVHAASPESVLNALNGVVSALL